MEFSQVSYLSTQEHKDEQFLCGFRGNDHHAWKQVFDIYYNRLIYFAKQLVKDEMEAQDIVIESFCKLWQRREKFETLNNIRAFLYITVRNACFDYLKHLQCWLAIQKEIRDLSCSNEYPLESFNHNIELLKIINDEIEKLPPQARQIFKMVYFEELKIADIAQKLQLTEQAVRNNKSRAINLLKTALIDKLITLM